MILRFETRSLKCLALNLSTDPRDPSCLPTSPLPLPRILHCVAQGTRHALLAHGL